MTEFCRHLTNGLVYNNNTSNFTVSPCCYFATVDTLTTSIDQHRQQWQAADIEHNCAICLQAERSGLTSYRQASFDIMPGHDNAIEMLTVAVNKQCNLACVSCNAYSSSFWYQENKRNQIAQPQTIHKLHVEDRQGLIKDNFLRELKTQDLSKLKYIKFGGGEPLMSDVHVEILKLVDHPEQVCLQYTSNFSIMPSQSVFDIWKQFKLVKWVASIDGVGARFDFLRWPYTWTKLQDFVERAWTAVPDNVLFGIEHTLNPLNVYYFDELQAWFDQKFKYNRCGDRSDLNLHLCNGELGIENTPPAVRALIKNTTIASLLEQNPYSGTTADMTKYLDKVCAQRNQNWRSIFPDVAECFDA